MKRDIARKLSPEARRALADPDRDGEHRLDVLMVTHRPLEPGQRERLARIGCRVETVAGDVVTADLPVRALPELAALDFVRYVELSRPLHLEHENRPARE